MAKKNGKPCRSLTLQCGLFVIVYLRVCVFHCPAVVGADDTVEGYPAGIVLLLISKYIEKKNLY